MAIYFYTTTDRHGAFSNFSRHGVEMDGTYWPTVEHYFQAQKFAGTDQEVRILRARTAKDAKRLGQDRSLPLRSDWEQVKDGIMRRAVARKFESHAEPRDLLLSTGDEELVENAPGDYYWGCGADGSGRNMLGVILMEVREALRCRAGDSTENPHK